MLFLASNQFGQRHLWLQLGHAHITLGYAMQKAMYTFWLDLGRRLARLPSPSVCPALLVPARLLSRRFA